MLKTLKKVFGLGNLAIYGVTVPAVASARVLLDINLGALNNNVNDEDKLIPPDFFKIQNNVLLGFNDDVKQSQLYNGRYNTLAIPDDVVEVADYAFSYMFDGVGTAINKLIIPGSVNKIGNYSFFRCTGLKSIIFDHSPEKPTRLSYIGNNAFEQCGFTGSLFLPSTLTIVGARAFYNCQSLNSQIVIPKSLATVGEFAFSDCTKVETIDLTDYKTIPTWMYAYQSAFRGVGVSSEGSKQVLIDTSIDTKSDWEDVIMTRQELKSSVSESQFAIISTQQRKEIPEYKLRIEQDKEKGTTILKGWDEDETVDLSQYNVLVIPDRVTNIGKNAFYDSGDKVGKIVDCNITIEFQGSKIDVGENAFRGCTGLVGVSDWTKINSFDANCFNGCSGLTGDVSIYANHVDSGALRNCIGLSKLTISKETDFIEKNAFNGCKGIHTFDLLDFDGREFAREDWYYSDDPTDTDLPFGGWGATGNVLLNSENERISEWPDALIHRGLNVSNQGWQILNTETVSCYDEYVAYSHNNSDCHGFSNTGKNHILEFNDVLFANRTQKICDSAFKDILTKSDYPNNTWSLSLNFGLSEIGKQAFANDSALTNCTNWPNSISKIDNEAFYDCANLCGEISIPRNLTYLGDFAFYNCKKLSSYQIVLPSCIKYIGESALDRVKAERIKFSKFSATIGPYAFSNNDWLKVIDLTDYDEIPTGTWKASPESFHLSGQGTVLIGVTENPQQWKEYLQSIGLPSEWNVQNVEA